MRLRNGTFLTLLAFCFCIFLSLSWYTAFSGQKELIMPSWYYGMLVLMMPSLVLWHGSTDHARWYYGMVVLIMPAWYYGMLVTDHAQLVYGM
ncbi:hypothetical protein GDO81_010893 [Engystomops pustulosus]|uniref:Uncharacterized protein n=1 Tax=Engystomops pustulosus TaxID=76066 RepID=A0AAV7C3A4_ENGPU|nr:hypothetical protein GDO81_010893 [Engystomops pustulosus]